MHKNHNAPSTDINKKWLERAVVILYLQYLQNINFTLIANQYYVREMLQYSNLYGFCSKTQHTYLI